MAAVYGQYDQSELDLQYNNQKRVPGFEQHVRWYQEQSQLARTGLSAHLDVSYGPSAEEYLDIYLPDSPGSAMPVQVFFHGGYWRAFQSGDFAFVANPITAAGGISVVVNYALMPGVTMGELLRQCTAAFDWVGRNIATHGGDPNRIHISGHSAGGHIVAVLLSRASDQGPSIAGSVAVSGIYDLEPIRLCFLNAELHLSPEDAQANSPLHRPPARVDGPVIVTYGAEESEEFARQSGAYHAALRQAGADATLTPIADRNHMTIVRDMGLADSQITGLILRQMSLA